MATAEEIRRRLAELNRDTAARLGTNPATESMRQRMAASDRVQARDFAAQGGQRDLNNRVNNAATAGRARAEAATAGNANIPRGGPAPDAVIDRSGGVTQQNPRASRGATQGARMGGLGQRFSNAAEAVRTNRAQRAAAAPPPGFMDRALSGLNRRGGQALTRVGSVAAPLARGAGAVGGLLAIPQAFEEGAAEDAFLRLGGDFAGGDVEDANAVTSALGVVDAATLGLAGAGSRFAGAVGNPRVDPLTGRPESGLDRFFGGVQAAINPDEARRNRGLPAPDRPAAPAPLANSPVAGDPSVVATVPPGGAMGADDTLAPNTVRREDGTVIPVDEGVQVNTMSAENFVRPSTGLSQRLGDARLAAAQRGDFGPEQLQADRTALATQLTGLRDRLRQEDTAEALRTLEARGTNPAVRRAMEARLGQLGIDADRAADVEVAGINADARRIPAQDPLMSPQVIAERLRQEGANQRAAMQPGENLMQGLEPTTNAAGQVTGVTGTDSRGVPINIPQSDIGLYTRQYQQSLQSGQIGPNLTFLDWVSAVLGDDGVG